MHVLFWITNVLVCDVCNDFLFWYYYNLYGFYKFKMTYTAILYLKWFMNPLGWAKFYWTYNFHELKEGMLL